MQREMHHDHSVKTGGNIINYYPDAFRQVFQLTNRRWLYDIEPTKKYKAQQQRFPRHRNRNESDELACNLVDHDELRVLKAACPRHPRGRRNANQDC